MTPDQIHKSLGAAPSMDSHLCGNKEKKVNTNLIVKALRHRDYLTTWQEMQALTDQRTANSPDEIWFVEHSPVYTLGQAGKREHILSPGNIPIIQTDRGGQVTYHGPGQLMVYVLLDLRRQQLGVRQLVSALEQSTIDFLADHDITAQAQRHAPGVYVGEAKICSIGLRIRRGCSYHGLAFNVAMDLKPFSGINPCGFANLPITQLSSLGGPNTLAAVIPSFTEHLFANLGYTSAAFCP